MKGGIAGRGEKEKSERRFKKSSQPIAAQHVWLSTDRKKPEDEEEKAPACAAQGDHNEEQDALSQLLQ
ncbi:MAG: hypothetical protein ACOYT9_01050 [Patescibacteria group bacterium]